MLPVRKTSYSVKYDMTECRLRDQDKHTNHQRWAYHAGVCTNYIMQEFIELATMRYQKMTRSNEPQLTKTYLLTNAQNEYSTQPAQLHSLIRVFVPVWRNFAPVAIQSGRVKILIRLRKCAVWSESSLGAHVRMYISWRCGSTHYCP